MEIDTWVEGHGSERVSFLCGCCNYNSIYPPPFRSPSVFPPHLVFNVSLPFSAQPRGRVIRFFALAFFLSHPFPCEHSR